MAEYVRNWQNKGQHKIKIDFVRDEDARKREDRQRELCLDPVRSLVGAELESVRSAKRECAALRRKRTCEQCTASPHQDVWCLIRNESRRDGCRMLT